MGKLADVLLEVYAGELYHAVFAHFGGVRPRELYFHAAADAQRLVVLRELVVFGAVGIEVVFSVPLGYLGNFAPEHKPHFYRLAYGVAVQDGQDARERPDDGVGERVRRLSETVADGGEHFAPGLYLDVDFESYDGFVFHGVLKSEVRFARIKSAGGLV